VKRKLQHLLMRRPAVYMGSRRLFGVARYCARSPHERDFAYFRRFGDRRGLFVDIGANSGISALAYRIFDRSSTIVSFEPNPFHERDLRLVRRIVGSDFSYELVALGGQAGELTLHVPVARRIPLTGDASLERDEALRSWTAQQLGLGVDELRIEEVRVPVRRLDGFELAPHAIKIDVQGTELAVLNGAAATLARWHPVLMVESSTEDDAISAYLRPLGYRPSLYDAASDALVPCDGRRTTNVFYVAR
jgi:FkbM family methyltransferase